MFFNRPAEYSRRSAIPPADAAEVKRDAGNEAQSVHKQCVYEPEPKTSITGSRAGPQGDFPVQLLSGKWRLRLLAHGTKSTSDWPGDSWSEVAGKQYDAP